MGHTLKKILGPALGVALGIMVGPNSKADVMTFDTSLTNPPGVYFGSGNPNSNFTTETNGITELGLSVIQRFVGPIDPGAGSNVYQVSTGATTVSGQTGSSWGFDFSVNTQYNGGTSVLGDFTYALTITDLTTSTTLGPLDAVRLIPDNYGFGPLGRTTGGVNVATEWGAQNSESPSFAGPSFNLNAPDLYQITLSALNSTTGAVETDTVFANASAPVPEPTSILLFGTVALGALVLGRRRGAQCHKS